MACADTLTVVPDGVSLSEASGLFYAHGTSYHALADRARLQPGESLVVLGAAGGVGLAAVEQLGAWWRDGRLTPFVSATFPLERGAEALAELAERRATGRVVVTSD